MKSFALSLFAIAAITVIGSPRAHAQSNTHTKLWTGFAGRIGLSYRLRLQSTKRSTETVNDIRNKIGAEYDLGGGLTPHGAAELHYSSTNSEFREVRFVVGWTRNSPRS